MLASTNGFTIDLDVTAIKVHELLHSKVLNGLHIYNLIQRTKYGRESSDRISLPRTCSIPYTLTSNLQRHTIVDILQISFR